MASCTSSVATACAFGKSGTCTVEASNQEHSLPTNRAARATPADFSPARPEALRETRSPWFYVFLLIVAGLALSVYLVFNLSSGPGAAEERLGVLEPCRTTSPMARGRRSELGKAAFARESQGAKSAVPSKKALGWMLGPLLQPGFRFSGT